VFTPCFAKISFNMRWLALSGAIALLAACEESARAPSATDSARPEATPAPAPPPVLVPTEPPPPELLEPVDLWKDGKPAGQIDAQGPAAGDHVFLDLGEGWTPILFSDGAAADGTPLPHSFRPVYLALARGEFKKDEPFYDRAREDKYLELYGIMPTLSVLRTRLHWAEKLECSKTLDLSAIASFNGVVAYIGPDEAKQTRERYLVARKYVERFLAAQQVSDASLLNAELLKDGERAQLKYYLRNHDDYEAIKAAQDRLACEGYFKGKGRWQKGAFDWATHEALNEFERRHRVYSWGAMGPDTLEALRMDTATVEHETVVRVLTERAVHAFGAIEDGSAVKGDKPIMFTGADGQQHPVPNLEAELRKAVVQAFGLHDPSTTAAFLDQLKLEKDGHLYVAIPGPRRPEYYSSDMELSVAIDRGDVWYEFPYDEQGQERPQPVSRRPHTTILVNYLGQKFPIARFGTTIGGWRSELIDNNVWWKYKGSPWGEVLWEEIVSAPVWLPPSSTPPRDLLKRREKRKPGETKWETNVHETGPSYASAYGLVAAYHREYIKRPDGSVRIGGDEGIRSHGSVDYMSIMRRHSHGCHRLHNHIAVRLFSFVVNHRPHVREGHQPTSFVMNLEYEEEKHVIRIKQGGYVFKLQKPIFVTVEEGRVRGKLERPIATAIPKFNSQCGGYYMPDGSSVVPRPDGVLLPGHAPPCETGLVPPPPPPSSDELNVVGTPLGQAPAQPPAAEVPEGERLGPATP
jgi:hypothetical protein